MDSVAPAAPQSDQPAQGERKQIKYFAAGFSPLALTSSRNAPNNLWHC